MKQIQLNTKKTKKNTKKKQKKQGKVYVLVLLKEKIAGEGKQVPAPGDSFALCHGGSQQAISETWRCCNRFGHPKPSLRVQVPPEKGSKTPKNNPKRPSKEVFGPLRHEKQRFSPPKTWLLGTKNKGF